MTLTIGVVMDNIHHLKRDKDTTLGLIQAAQTRGHRVIYFEPQALLAKSAEVWGWGQTVTVDLKADEQWYRLGDPQCYPLRDCAIILMRQDPPFTVDYLHVTYLLELAEQQGVLVANKPQAVRDINEKVSCAWFPECSPPSLISAQAKDLRDFIETEQVVIVKPLDAMGGQGIFKVTPMDPNLTMILETLTHQGKRQIMAQRFLPEIANGDKRIILINGEPIPYALARMAKPGEVRANLAAGGTGIAQPLSVRDKWLANQVGPVLAKRGLWLVGLDVIGDYITEINVTSPTGIREIEKAYTIDIAGQFWRTLEHTLSKRQ